MPRPATVLVSGDQATVIRRGESEADVFRRDVVPDHLNLSPAATLAGKPEVDRAGRL